MKLNEKIEFWCIFIYPILMNGSIFSYSLIRLMQESGTDLAKFFAFVFLFLYFGATVAGMIYLYDIENDEI